MPNSKLFLGDSYKSLSPAIANMLNSQPYFLSPSTATSPRAAGDAIQSILSDHLGELLGSFAINYSPDFARRAMADIAFEDTDGNYYRVDVKTHRLHTGFNMPNLTSVERLARFYEDDRNYFVVLLVEYEAHPEKVIAREVKFVPIEWLSWVCLTVGALGWGQIQIANANRITIVEGYPRNKWMLDFCEAVLGFYPREISKIGERIDYFERVRERWRAK